MAKKEQVEVEIKQKKGHPFRSGLFWGLLLGGGLALLFAPKPGRAVRQSLTDRMGNVQLDEFHTTAREAMIDLNTVFKNWRTAKQSQVEGAFAQGREAADAARADMQREYGQRLAGGPPPGVAGGPPPTVAGGPPQATPATPASGPASPPSTPSTPPSVTGSRPSENGADGESRNGS